MKTFSEKLKELRTEKGLTQKQISDDLKISVTGYAGYEQGVREPNFSVLKKLCKYFDVSTDYLLGITDSE